MSKRPRVIECGRCGHPHYHCPASGCNADDCECETFQQVTELELTLLEDIAAGKNPWKGEFDDRIVTQALGRLKRRGCLVDTLQGPNAGGRFVIQPAGRAVLLGCPPSILHDLLSLVMERPPAAEDLAKLTRDQREEIRDWAGREHASASDNPVRRKPRPSVLSD